MRATAPAFDQRPASSQLQEPAAAGSAPLGGPVVPLRVHLASLFHNIHRIAKDNNISSDSGDSAVAFFALPATLSPSSDRASTNDSISTTSTITPERLHRLSQASTLTAGSTSSSSGSQSSPLSIKTDDAAAGSILGQLAGAEGSVVASPSTIKANEPFFPATAPRPPPSSLRAAVGAKSLNQSASSLTTDDFELQESWRAISRELKPIADVLRTDRLRSVLGSSSLPAECVAALRLSLKSSGGDALMEAQTEILRVLANLCIDHEDNRSVMHTLSAAPLVTTFVSHVIAEPAAPSAALYSSKVLSLLRTAMGAVLNLQLEHIPTRQALLSADSLSTLTRVASHPHVYLPIGSSGTLESGAAGADLLERLKLGSTVSSWAWRVVQEVCEDEKEDKQPMVGRPSSDSSQDPDDDGENMVKALLSQQSLGDLLRPFLHYATPTKVQTTSLAEGLGADVDDVEELVETDAEVLATVAELIEGCATDEKDFRLAAVKSGSAGPLGPVFGASSRPDDAAGAFRSPLDLMMSFVEVGDAPSIWQPATSGSAVTVQDAELSAEALKSFAKAKASIARAIVAVAGEDANMNRLFGGADEAMHDDADADVDRDLGSWYIDRLKVWMRSDPKERDDLVSCGMLALGNLARSDAHCLALVDEHQLAPFLRSLLSPTNDIKVSHGIVSLLKNLSIPAANKGVIGSLGVIESVTPFLFKDKDMVQPLQFGTVGLLKQLCAGVPQNAVRVVSLRSVPGQSASTLSALLELAKRVDDVPTRLEATRVVVNIIKALWSSTGDGITAEVAEARSAVVRRDAIQALAEMVRTSPKYPILVNEGIFALTLVGSEPTGAEFVAQSLLHEPARPPPESEDEAMNEDEQDDAALAARATRRRSTHDSATSNGSQPLPPPAAAVDMVCSVLARRDARMPPQFAANACMLISSLLQARPDGAAPAGRADATTEVAGRAKPALVRLKEQGPTEALESAARALEAVVRLVGQ